MFIAAVSSSLERTMTEKPSGRKPSRPSLRIPPDMEPVYVNLVRIAHAPAEIVLEFAHVFPGTPQARMKSRLLMSPLSAKLFYRALADNLAKYEARYGEIHVPGDKDLAEYSKLFKPPDTAEEPPSTDEPPSADEPPEEE